MKNLGVGLVLVEVMLVVVAVLIQADRHREKVDVNRLFEPDTTVHVNPDQLRKIPQLKILQSGRVRVGSWREVSLDSLGVVLAKKGISKVRLKLGRRQAHYLSLVASLRKSGIETRIPVQEKSKSAQ